MKKLSCTTISFLLFLLNTVAQQKSFDTTTIKILDDIEAIQAVYLQSDHISFRATYFMEDVDTVTVRDTSVAQYKINGEKFHLLIDSIESIQDDYYFGTIYRENKSIVVQKPVPLPRQVLGVDVKDSMFQQLVMAGMVSADSGSFRKIIIQFTANAPFIHYEVLFNKSTYQVSDIKYSLRKEADSSSLKRINMDIKFDGYKTNDFDDTVFITANFFKVINGGTIQPGPSLPPDYEIINLLKSN